MSEICFSSQIDRFALTGLPFKTDINRISSWMQENKLFLSMGKTEYVIYCSHKGNNRTRNTLLRCINYSCSSYPIRPSYSGQVHGWVWKPNETLALVFEILLQKQIQVFLIYILTKQEKHMTINNCI